MESSMWWEKDPARFMEEMESMQQNTNAVLRVLDGKTISEILSANYGTGPHLVWEEKITSNSGRKYWILIACHARHPYSAPGAWIIDPVIRGQHHMFSSDNRLCLHEYNITPDKTYVLNIRNWACEWVHCYETGDWRTLSQ